MDEEINYNTDEWIEIKNIGAKNIYANWLVGNMYHRSVVIEPGQKKFISNKAEICSDQGYTPEFYIVEYD